MLKNASLAAALMAATILGASSLALAHQSGMQSGNPQYGCPHAGQMGPMMGQQGQMPMMGQQGQMPMMGQGMMGQGMTGQGMMQPLRQDRTTAEVQHMLGHQLAWQGNPNLKLGPVAEKDDDTIVADIVTQDGSLVQKLEIDRHTGWMHAVQ